MTRNQGTNWCLCVIFDVFHIATEDDERYLCKRFMVHIVTENQESRDETRLGTIGNGMCLSNISR